MVTKELKEILLTLVKEVSENRDTINKLLAKVKRLEDSK